MGHVAHMLIIIRMQDNFICFLNIFIKDIFVLYIYEVFLIEELSYDKFGARQFLSCTMINLNWIGLVRLIAADKRRSVED